MLGAVVVGCMRVCIDDSPTHQWQGTHNTHNPRPNDSPPEALALLHRQQRRLELFDLLLNFGNGFLRFPLALFRRTAGRLPGGVQPLLGVCDSPQIALVRLFCVAAVGELVIERIVGIAVRQTGDSSTGPGLQGDNPAHRGGPI